MNVLRFLEPPPYVNVSIEGPPVFDEGVVDVDIGLRNPYDGFDQYTGFDVCGIIFTRGSLTGFHDPEITMAGEGDTRLLNADGYSRWWNPAEFPHGDTIFSYKDGLLGKPAAYAGYNCTVNGYKYFADGLGKMVDDFLDGVAGDVDPIGGKTLGEQIRAAVLGVGQKHRAGVIDDPPVDLLGHAIVVAAVAGFHVIDGDPHPASHDGGHAAVGVAENEEAIGLIKAAPLLQVRQWLRVMKA